MAHNKITPELAAELTRLALIADDEIDTSDIPEAIDWSGAKRGLFSTDRIKTRRYDVRALANWFLDRAEAVGRPLSNMSINKIVYLALERSLVERQVLITPARIEAWDHGPVFRELYQAFKSFNEKPIAGRASRFSIEEKRMVEARDVFEPEDEKYFSVIFDRFGEKTAAQLRTISHVRNGPWYKVWNYRGSSNPGMEITTAIIFEYAPKWRDVDEER